MPHNKTLCLIVAVVTCLLVRPSLVGAQQETADFDFAQAGLPESVLRAPYDVAQYYFATPAHWEILPGSYLELDLLYEALNVAYLQNARPSIVEVRLDGNVLTSFPLTTPGASRHRIELPASTGPRSYLEIRFTAHTDCETWSGITLTVRQSSSLHFVYRLRPMPMNLADFPYPFYQRSFVEPDGVLLVVPDEPTEREVTAAAVLAATLGRDTAGRVPVSVTTDLDLDPVRRADHHLIVVGSPRRNSLLATLVTTPTCPVALYTSQVTMTALAPTTLSPGRLVTYTFAISPSASLPLSSLLSVALYPSAAWATDCRPECTWQGDRTLTWQVVPSPDKTITFTLALYPPLESTGKVVELLANLIGEENRPLASIALTGTVVAGDAGQQAIVGRSFFFVVNGRPSAQGDGVLGEMVSPWNPARAVLLVTGLDDRGVLKAALALSDAPKMPGPIGDATAISAIRFPSLRAGHPFSTTLTLADLGYADRTVVGAHGHEIEYRFELPLGAVLTEQAALHLRFRHTRLISADKSSVTVELNKRPLESAPLTAETADGTELTVPLPPSIARSGQRNRLLIKVQLEPLDPCVDPSAGYFWFTVAADSYLELPYRSVNVKSLWNLDFYPFPFGHHPNLQQVAFVLPRSPTDFEVEIMARLAADLGDAADGRPLFPAVILGRPQDATELAGRHIILIGRPTRNPLLHEINGRLPQPFIPGSDQIEQVLDQVVLRLPPGLDLGYLQLIPSPWDEERALLAVTGTTDEGMNWAARVLTTPQLAWQLKGNLALVRDREITTADTRGLTSEGVAALTARAVPEMSPGATATVTITVTAAATTTRVAGGLDTPSPPRLRSPAHVPRWLPFFVGATAAAIAIILGIAYWQSRRGSRQP